MNQDSDNAEALNFTKEFRENGYAIVDNILPVGYIKKLHAAFNKTYQHYSDEQYYAENNGYLEVGSRRYMCSVDLSGNFGESLIYANPHVLPKVRALLGNDAIIESYGAVISLPGAKAQHRHRDGQLFGGVLGRFVPPHALTLVIPLIEMNGQHGSTAFWPGTHLPTLVTDPDEDVQPIVPTVPIGSCALWDYRVLHSGTPNLSRIPRPILYITYSKNWFRDTKNYIHKNQRRISFQQGFLEGLANEHKALFSHVVSSDWTSSGMVGSKE